MKKIKNFNEITFVDDVERTYCDDDALVMIKNYVKNSDNLNITNKYKETLLIICVRNDFIKSVRFLIKNGVDINFKSIDDITSIMVAENLKMLKLLINNDVDINAENINGITALRYLITDSDDDNYKEYKKCMKYLIKNGANIHQLDNEKNTLLMESADHHNEELVNLFVDCNWNQKNIEDKDIFDIMSNSFEIDHMVEEFQNDYPEKYQKYLKINKANNFKI